MVGRDACSTRGEPGKLVSNSALTVHAIHLHARLQVLELEYSAESDAVRCNLSCVHPDEIWTIAACPSDMGLLAIVSNAGV